MTLFLTAIVIGFVLLLWIGRKYVNRLLDGDIFSLYLIWYSTGRLLIESLRPDAWTLGGIPTAQIVSIIVVFMYSFLSCCREFDFWQNTIKYRFIQASEGG